MAVEEVGRRGRLLGSIGSGRRVSPWWCFGGMVSAFSFSLAGWSWLEVSTYLCFAAQRAVPEATEEYTVCRSILGATYAASMDRHNLASVRQQNVVGHPLFV